MASYNEKYGTNFNYTDQPFLRTNPNDDSSSIDTLYMPHPGSGPYNKCEGYWLNSPSSGDIFVWYVEYIGWFARYGAFGDIIGICPVVSLPSNLQVTNNGGVWSLVNN